jgi:hypothetical protein
MVMIQARSICNTIAHAIGCEHDSAIKTSSLRLNAFATSVYMAYHMAVQPTCNYDVLDIALNVCFAITAMHIMISPRPKTCVRMILKSVGEPVRHRCSSIHHMIVSTLIG